MTVLDDIPPRRDEERNGLNYTVPHWLDRGYPKRKPRHADDDDKARPRHRMPRAMLVFISNVNERISHIDLSAKPIQN